MLIVSIMLLQFEPHFNSKHFLKSDLWNCCIMTALLEYLNIFKIELQINHGILGTSL